MREVKEWVCPYYNRVVDEDECLDMYLVATRSFRDEKLVNEKDRDALCAVCDKCKKHGIIDAGDQK